MVVAVAVAVDVSVVSEDAFVDWLSWQVFAAGILCLVRSIQHVILYFKLA